MFHVGRHPRRLCARPSDRAPPTRVRTRTSASPRFAPAPSAVAAATVLPSLPPPPCSRFGARAIAARASPPSRIASDLDDGSPFSERHRRLRLDAARHRKPRASRRRALTSRCVIAPRAARADDERRPEIPYLQHAHHQAPHQCAHECDHPCPVLVPVPSTEPSSVPTTGASPSRSSMPQFRHRYPLSRRPRPLPSSVPAATAHTKRCPACHPEPSHPARRLRAIARRSLRFKCDPARHLARSKCADAVSLRTNDRRNFSRFRSSQCALHDSRVRRRRVLHDAVPHRPRPAHSPQAGP